MKDQVFISYRRAESLKDARHLATLLDRGRMRGRIFIDVKGLDGSRDWVHELERQVAASAVMIALICPGWQDLKDGQGSRRIDSIDDPVRCELAAAFRLSIPVVPVLVDGAQMPRAASLPDNLVLVTRPQAEVLRAETFEADAATIAKRLVREFSAKPATRVRWQVAAFASSFALLFGIGIGASLVPVVGFTSKVARNGSDDQMASRMSQRIAELEKGLAASKLAAQEAETRAAARLRRVQEIEAGKAGTQSTPDAATTLPTVCDPQHAANPARVAQVVVSHVRDHRRRGEVEMEREQFLDLLRQHLGCFTELDRRNALAELARSNSLSCDHRSLSHAMSEKWSAPRIAPSQKPEC